MNFKQYVGGKRQLYGAFAETIRTIIATVLDGQPSIPKPQQIHARAKSAPSLARKLKERGLERSQSLERELKDLAGVRLIFYTNAHEQAFLGSLIINENFHVDYDASKVHHPVGEPEDVNEQYRGIHYVITLNDERLKLPEYSRFAGLRCEIQIQTILNHAWSETAHDILYHRPGIATGFGTKQYERIHKRMAAIIQKHLVPAGHEFSKVHDDFQRLMTGKELFDRGIIKALQEVNDNNERCQLIDRIRVEVLPLYDDVSTIAKDLRDALVDAMHRARTTPTMPIEVGPGFGSFPGQSEADVAQSALKTINYLRYIDVVATFAALIDLYPGAKSDAERKHILESGKELAEPNLNILRQSGPVVQNLVVQEVLKLGCQARIENRQVIQCICKNVLNSEVRGVSSETYETFTILTGAVAGTDQLADTREKALDVLLDLYVAASSPTEKRECYDALAAAMNLPSSAQYGEPLWLLVNRDTRTILDFFVTRGVNEPYGILQDLETHCWRVFQNATGVKNTEPKKEKVIASYDELLVSVDRFRDLINSDETYQKYKTFVGYRAIFEDDLSKETIDWRRRDAARQERTAKYLADINDSSSDHWLDLLKKFSDERDAYQHLIRFGEMVGKDKPKIAVKWLTLKETPDHLRYALLLGLFTGSEANRAADLVREWIAQGIHLRSVARLIRHKKEVPDDLLPSLAEKALALRDIVALEELVPALVSRGDSLDSSYVDKFFLPAIEELAKASNWNWLFQMYPDEQEQPFLERFSSSQAKRVLNCLVDVPSIDYQAERFLVPIAKAHPSDVLGLFQQRDARETQRSERYEAIPFSLDELCAPLAANPDLVISTMRTWYSADCRLFQFKGARLLSLVFPAFSKPFANALQALVRKDPAAIDFVLAVLHNYEGEVALHETFKVIVSRLPEQDQRLSSVETALEATGVVRGEFGFVKAHQEKRQAVEPWLQDKRRRVRKFAARYIRSLDRAIAAEQRRAEAELELRKHRFDPEAD